MSCHQRIFESFLLNMLMLCHGRKIPAHGYSYRVPPECMIGIARDEDSGGVPMGATLKGSDKV